MPFTSLCFSTHTPVTPLLPDLNLGLIRQGLGKAVGTQGSVANSNFLPESISPGWQATAEEGDIWAPASIQEKEKSLMNEMTDTNIPPSCLQDNFSPTPLFVLPQIIWAVSYCLLSLSVNHLGIPWLSKRHRIGFYHLHFRRVKIKNATGSHPSNLNIFCVCLILKIRTPGCRHCLSPHLPRIFFYPSYSFIIHLRESNEPERPPHIPQHVCVCVMRNMIELPQIQSCICLRQGKCVRVGDRENVFIPCQPDSLWSIEVNEEIIRIMLWLGTHQIRSAGLSAHIQAADWKWEVVSCVIHAVCSMLHFHSNARSLSCVWANNPSEKSQLLHNKQWIWSQLFRFLCIWIETNTACRFTFGD